MKRIYDFLKYVIWCDIILTVGKTIFDFFNYRSNPDAYAFNSAPWYTGALLYAALSLALIAICFIAGRIIFKKMMKNAKTVVKTELNSDKS